MAGGRIVVGVDGSPGAAEALRFALEEAKLRDASVVAVLAWTLPPVATAPEALLPTLRGDLEQEARDALDAALAEIDASGVELERLVAEGQPARVLVKAAEGADLLVVGSRGRGGFAGLLLGSVGQQCTHHAPCPVVIVPRAVRG